MELGALLLGLFLLITLLMPWINHARFGAIAEDIKRLKDEMRYLRSQLSYQDQEIPEQDVKQSLPLTNVTEEIEEGISPEYIEEKIEILMPPEPPAYMAESPKTDWVQKAQLSFEQNIATKLPVWIGALSLICAAFFLVKYSIELGWMQPAVRVLFGVLFGAGLTVAGQWVIRRDYIANYERIAQGLVGAGIVALYVSIYAAFDLYGLVAPLLAFGGMAGVTALAVILSLRHGQPIAVFGLLGGLLTPGLVGSDESNATAMFTYLALLFSGMFSVLIRKNWWVLAIIAVIGVYGWSVIWFFSMFVASDAVILVVFTMVITTVILAVTGNKILNDTIDQKYDLPVHTLNFTAIAGGVITIILVGLKMSLTLFDWSVLGLLGMAVMTLAYFKPAIYQKPVWVMLGASLVLYYFWAESAPLTDAVAVIAGIATVYIGGTAFLMRQVGDPRFWVCVQAVTGVSLYALSYFKLDIHLSLIESFDMFWGILSLVLAGLTILQAADIRKKYHADVMIKDHLIAIYVLAASAFIAMGLSVELPWEYLPLAIAGQIAVTAWIYHRSGIAYLKNIVTILTLVFVAMHYEQFILFFDLGVSSLKDNVPRLFAVNRYFIDAPLIKLGIPTVLMGVALWLFAKDGKIDGTFFHVVFGTVLTSALVTAYYLFGYSIYGDYASALSTRAGFTERGVVTIMFAVIGFGLLEIGHKRAIEYLKPWAVGLLMIAALRHIYFDYLICNPYFARSQFVGDMPLFNGITLVYGFGALLWAWAARSNAFVFQKTPCKILGFISLFAFITFSVRQYFHGGNMFPGTVEPIELYSYSVAWLLTGLGLLAIGIHQQNKTARMASLAFIILAVLKVFLYDAAELEGLYRIFSFLGLGVSLIGLSFFYTRFAFSDKAIAGK